MTRITSSNHDYDMSAWVIEKAGNVVLDLLDVYRTIQREKSLSTESREHLTLVLSGAMNDALKLLAFGGDGAFEPADRDIALGADSDGILKVLRKYGVEGHFSLRSHAVDSEQAELPPGIRPFVPVVRQVIELARLMNKAGEGSAPDSSLLSAAQAVEHFFPPTEQPDYQQRMALKGFINNLSIGDQIKLQTVMYFGRDRSDGDDSLEREDFEAVLESMRRNPDHAADTLASKAPLVEYLETGLKMCSELHIDLDSI